MFSDSDKPVRLISHDEDQPVEARGSLIPQPRTKLVQPSFTPRSAIRSQGRSATRTAISIFAIAVLAVLGTSGYGYIVNSSQPAAPVLSLVDQVSKSATQANYGEMAGFSQSALFLETRDAFIEEGLTFIEIDEEAKQLRYFADEVLLLSEEILNVAEAGSVHELASGLYQVEDIREEQFSILGQVNLPWLIKFHGNNLIHGLPTYPNGDTASKLAGGVTLSDEGASRLYSVVELDIPIIVREAPEMDPIDTFVYQPQVPDVSADSYLVVDSNNDTVLVGKDITEPLPIASITKLMTAVVATEQYDLDTRVRVASPSFVTSLVPRLNNTSSVTMYSLLQLLLLESSNEAAESIAGELGRADFIDAMNQKARQLGMMDTTFTDPSGLRSDNISTAKDLQTLIEYILADKSFILSITAGRALPSVYVGDEFRDLINFNEVSDMDTFIGGKVGETSAASQTSVALHRLEISGQEREVVVVVLGSESRSEDIDKLLTYIKTIYDN